MLHFSEGLPCRSTIESIQTEQKMLCSGKLKLYRSARYGSRHVPFYLVDKYSFSIYHGELEKVDLIPEHVSLKLIAFGSMERCDFQDVSLGCQHQNTT